MTDPTSVVPVAAVPYIKDTEEAYSGPEGEARYRLATSPLRQLQGKQQTLETGTSRANPQT